MADLNPFPGPQPYRADDRGRFFGRDRAARALADAVLGKRLLTVYGPSGAGKSSLLQAAVVPAIEEEWDVRPVVVDSWPPEAVARAGPEQRLVAEIARQLELGAVPETLGAALALAGRRSSRPVVLVLDQSEQILAHHPAPVIHAFAETLATLDQLRGVGLHVVVTLREDYLGRWNTLLDRHPRLGRDGFRVARLTIPEMLDAVCRTAALGRPTQLWPRYRVAELVEAMALPGEWRSDAAEVEAAYVQIVCRALWEGGGITDGRVDPDRVLRGYLDRTLGALGPLQGPARELLENQFVTAGGVRVPVARAAAVEVLGDEARASRILDALEDARILRAQEHRGDRFYEVGHDWLASSLREAGARRRVEKAGEVEDLCAGRANRAGDRDGAGGAARRVAGRQLHRAGRTAQVLDVDYDVRVAAQELEVGGKLDVVRARDENLVAVPRDVRGRGPVPGGVVGEVVDVLPADPVLRVAVLVHLILPDLNCVRVDRRVGVVAVGAVVRRRAPHGVVLVVVVRVVVDADRESLGGSQQESEHRDRPVEPQCTPPPGRRTRGWSCGRTRLRAPRRAFPRFVLGPVYRLRPFNLSFTRSTPGDSGTQ